MQVRHVLLALADLLQGLETSLFLDSNISSRLRTHIPKIDAYIKEPPPQHPGQRDRPPTIPPQPSLLDTWSSTGIAYAPTGGGDGAQGDSNSVDWVLSLPPEYLTQLQADLSINWLQDSAASSGPFDLFGDLMGPNELS